MSQYIYHLKPNPFEGEELVPLNQLKKESGAYVERAKKYQGRAKIMEAVIPHLDCLWNDVIHFSTINPQLVYQEITKVDKDIKVLRPTVLRLDVSKVIGTYPAVLFHPSKSKEKKEKSDFSLTDQEVTPLADMDYKELTEVPERTIEYWKKSKDLDQKLLWFAFIPHVFIKSTMPLSLFDELQMIK